MQQLLPASPRALQRSQCKTAAARVDDACYVPRSTANSVQRPVADIQMRSSYGSCNRYQPPQRPLFAYTHLQYTLQLL
jgi:hypothetical protein